MANYKNLSPESVVAQGWSFFLDQSQTRTFVLARISSNPRCTYVLTFSSWPRAIVFVDGSKLRTASISIWVSTVLYRLLSSLPVEAWARKFAMVPERIGAPATNCSGLCAWLWLVNHRIGYITPWSKLEVHKRTCYVREIKPHIRSFLSLILPKEPTFVGWEKLQRVTFTCISMTSNANLLATTGYLPSTKQCGYSKVPQIITASTQQEHVNRENQPEHFFRQADSTLVSMPKLALTNSFVGRIWNLKSIACYLHHIYVWIYGKNSICYLYLCPWICLYSFLLV